MEGTPVTHSEPDNVARNLKQETSPNTVLLRYRIELVAFRKLFIQRLGYRNPGQQLEHYQQRGE